MVLLRNILVLAFLCSLSTGAAQAFDDDAKLWINTAFSTKITKKIEGALMLQNRLNNNFSQYSGYSSFTLNYKLNKYFKLTGGYVLGARHELNGNYSAIQQAFAGLIIRRQFQNTQLSFRSIVQSQQRGFSSLDYGSTLRLFSRNKLSLRFSLSRRLDAIAATEIYFTLLDEGKFEPIGRTRLQAGFNYKLSRTLDFEPYFLFQRNYERSGQASRGFIYGITLKKEF